MLVVVILIKFEVELNNFIVDPLISENNLIPININPIQWLYFEIFFQNFEWLTHLFRRVWSLNSPIFYFITYNKTKQKINSISKTLYLRGQFFA